MPLYYENLDQRTRELMISEVDDDVAANKLYMSSRFSVVGKTSYEALLRQAITSHSDAWLVDQLRNGGCFNSYEQKKKPKGGYTMAAVPVTAPETFAEGEFNRYYARAVCLRAVAEGRPNVEVYRGKQVTSPRLQSEALIGRRFDAVSLLNDLRTSQGVEPGLGLPPGPNSGLTIRLV